MEFGHHQNWCVPVACSHDPVEKIGKVWHKFWWPLLPNRSISHEGSWFSKRRRVNSNSSGRWLHQLASWKFPRYTITIIPQVWFSGAFEVSLAIFKTFFRLTCILCIKIKLQPKLHVLSKGMRIVVRSGSIQRCRRTIRGVWFLANQKARLRSWAGWSRGLVGTWLSSTNRVLFANQIAYFCSHIL